MADCTKFQSAPLENIELLTEVSDGASATGASSAIPGAYMGGDEDANIVDSNDDCDDSDDGTMHHVGGAKVADKKPKGRPKRSMSASIPHSSKKCREDPIVRLERLLDFPVSKKVKPVGESFEEIMDLVVQSGAEEGSVEHRIARKLFIKLEYRYMFLTLKSNKVRLGWLKRLWEEKRRDVVSIPEIMDLVVQCGAEECSDEYFVATTLLIKPEYREIFLGLNANKERFAWLKRMWEEKKKR